MICIREVFLPINICWHVEIMKISNCILVHLGNFLLSKFINLRIYFYSFMKWCIPWSGASYINMRHYWQDLLHAVWVMSSSSNIATPTVINNAGNCSQHSQSTKLTSQSWNMIMSVFHFFAHEGWWKTMAKVEKTLQLQYKSHCEQFKASNYRKWDLVETYFAHLIPEKEKSTNVEHLDNYDGKCMRRELLSVYDRGELPTISSLLERVKLPPVNFSGSRSTLYKIVKNLGFRYKKVMRGRKFLLKRSDIVNARN